MCGYNLARWKCMQILNYSKKVGNKKHKKNPQSLHSQLSVLPQLLLLFHLPSQAAPKYEMSNDEISCPEVLSGWTCLF